MGRIKDIAGKKFNSLPYEEFMKWINNIRIK